MTPPRSPISSQPPSVTSRRRGWRWWLRQVERAFAVIGVTWVMFHFTLMSSVIVSPSMAPTLQGKSWADGDRVLTELVTYRFRSPRRWEVVAFRRTDGTIVMKRVVGLPGEQVQMRRQGELVINGQLVERPASLSHLRYIPIGRLFEEGAVDCQRGYCVLGDDSKDSEDSRYDGPIPAEWIVGRAWLIVAPWSRFGRVNR
ncbi:MAG: signal peptidase I [Planctomycetaceae bacterium]